MTQDQRKELASEYALLQGQYEQFDQRALTIKSWAAPLLTAGVGLGLKDGSAVTLCAVIVAALLLWLIEAIWKSFQYSFIERITHLEELFRRDPAEAVPPFQIFEAWGDSYRRSYRSPAAVLKIMALPFVFLPYLPIVAAAAGGLAFLAR